LLLFASPRPHRGSDARIKIGFLVKQPEEPWFQQEWRFADLAAAKYGFEVIKIGVTDGEKVLSAIDNLAALGAGGLVICTPNVKLGPSIVAKARSDGLKLMSVDDRFVDSAGTSLDAVPHMGIAASEIGWAVGMAADAEMRRRGWGISETAVMSISYYELQTAKERNEAAIGALTARAFPAAQIFDIPQKVPLDVESGLNAAQVLLTKHPAFKNWIVIGLNDETVMGGIRATENRGFPWRNVIGVGIGGEATADAEFKKKDMTGFFATIAISPRRHGFDTAFLMWRWIKDEVAPPLFTLTPGVLMTRENEEAVLVEMGLK
jgi:L-arabinose transport system substrate-binding protein